MSLRLEKINDLKNLKNGDRVVLEKEGETKSGFFFEAYDNLNFRVSEGRWRRPKDKKEANIWWIPVYGLLYASFNKIAFAGKPAGESVRK